jgi:hypothetical protein
MINKHKVGLALGSLAGTLHAAWSLLVAVGWAKPLMDFFYGLHFMNNPMMVQEFSVGNAILLILVASLVGYAAGWLFGSFWNRLHK